MKYRLLCILLTLVLCALAASSAFAETTTFTHMDATYTVTTFEAEFPAEVDAALTALGVKQGRRICGVALTSALEADEERLNGSDASLRAFEKNHYWDWNFTSVLCVLDREGTQWAIGLRRDADGVWSVTLESDRVVLPGREYSLSVDSDHGNWVSERYLFTYPRTDGGSDVYALDCGTSVTKWRVAWYEHRTADGGGLHVEAYGFDHNFQVWPLPKEEDDRTGVSKFSYYLDQYLSFGSLLCWRGVGDFPTSAEDAQRIAQADLDALPKNCALIGGTVNLRRKPSTSAQSLGRYYSGTIGTLLDVQGDWYHVRIGDAEGYVSTPYVCSAEEYRNIGLGIVAAPLPIGTLLRDCELRQSPDEIVQTSLSQGASVLVMGETDDGRLHVTVSPVGGIMQLDAPTGYLPADAVAVSGQ